MEPKTHTAAFSVRWMIRRDMDEVLGIEQASFPIPWTEEDFLQCLRQRNCIGMIAERNEQVVGFMIYEMHKEKLHIVNFAVHPSWRRQGVGAAMVKKLVSKLSGHTRYAIDAYIRETNLGALLFGRSQGFIGVRVLRDYYDVVAEDAIVMQYRLVAAASEPPVFTNRITQYL